MPACKSPTPDDCVWRLSCDRCQVEAQSASGGGAMAVDAAAGLSDDDDGEHWEQGGDGYSPEYALWFLKNVCPRPGCGGTLAPVRCRSADRDRCRRALTQARPALSQTAVHTGRRHGVQLLRPHAQRC